MDKDTANSFCVMHLAVSSCSLMSRLKTQWMKSMMSLGTHEQLHEARPRSASDLGM